ncbi:hypothetical protein [Aeromicrobium sp. Leaf350]|uniref:hypothetical protein n=1 Tax=Aeromicrobium sp. Leaf350 TaxID=2876565 RepID=UPI001E320EEF|nr:hypothetical protein [Aeromicrobium sp. Leaf350]
MSEKSTPSPDGTPPSTPKADVDEARSFALSEDWLATIVGLVVVALAAAGVITADWIPL